jgi:hypothetical protein
MYEPGTLRPPTAADMARRELPLEVIKIEHHLFCYPPDDPAERAEMERYGTIDYGCDWYRHVDESYAHSVADLIAVCRDYGIPYEAHLVTTGYEGERGLDWSHLAECSGCGAWFASHLADEHALSDEHLALLADRERRTAALKERAARERREREFAALAAAEGAAW